MSTLTALCRTATIAAAATLLVGTAVAAPSEPAKPTPANGANSPTLTHDNPSSCLGAERASRNSNGGDREHGAFGEAQSAYVHYLLEAPEGMSYGQWLQTWKAACGFPPGGEDDGPDDDTDG
ncbi:hypothetical protein [Caulobacter sp. 1776]|uniref:hypothetical protein n=1 Tax=Caulobacter sp. 1776 TaxID=3156420 RepID=UPI00339821D0